jgi:hypothetical protein
MLTLEAISSAVDDLSYEDKLKLRTLLDRQLESVAPNNYKQQGGKTIVGLFSDEPELIDQVLESVYERRSRPLRVEE